MAPNQVEEDVTIEPSDKTAVTDNTVDNTKQKSEPEPDYKVKFSESSKEALRLRDELKKKEELEAQWQEVADVINTDPELLKTIQSKYDQKYNPGQETTTVSDKVVESKVQEKMKPLQNEVEDLRRQQVEQAVTNFTKVHPDASEGTERWQKIISYLPAMKAARIPFTEGLEKAYRMTLLDEAETSGKVDVLRDVFTKTQAAAGGGVSGGSQAQAVEVELTPQEKKVAANLNMTPKQYAEWKIKK